MEKKNESLEKKETTPIASPKAEEISGMQLVKEVKIGETHNSFSDAKKAYKTSKYNLYINLNTTDKITGTTTAPSMPGASVQATTKQDMVFGLGAEYNDLLFGITRYTCGAMLQMERSFSTSKYSGTNLYARIEHPFDSNHPDNYLGLELNFFIAGISNLPSYVTNTSFRPKLGFAIYERKYFQHNFIEMGIRRLLINMNYLTSGSEQDTEFESTGLYFLAGMSF